MKCKMVVVVAAVAALALSACSSDKKSGSPSSSPNGSASGTVTILTSGVYQDLVGRLVKAYTTNHKGAKVNVVTSSTPNQLKATVAQKRPAIILLVNPQFQALGKGVKPSLLATDRAVIAVSDKNPKKVTSVKAFASNSGMKTSMCGTRTGFGNTTQWVLYRAKVTPDPKTVGVDCEAESMRKLVKNELDAVLLFRGGTYPPKGVKLLDVPADQNVIFKISYVVSGTTPAAKQFGAFLAAPGARQILSANGYLT